MKKKGRAICRVGAVEVHGHDLGDLAQILVLSGSGIAGRVEDDLPALLDRVDLLRADHLGQVHDRGHSLGFGDGDDLALPGWR